MKFLPFRYIPSFCPLHPTIRNKENHYNQSNNHISFTNGCRMCKYGYTQSAGGFKDIKYDIDTITS